jgi:outer membrane protein, heavy metal efflux system
MYKFFRRAAWLAVANLAWPWPASAAPCRELSQANLARCVHDASLTRRAGEAAVRAANGRVQANEPWFPSSPTLALSASRRRTTEQSALNWSASLDVELEIAGQRGARRAAATAEREAEQSTLSASERAATAAAFHVYFELLAAREERRVLEKLELVTGRVAEAARAAAERGAGAGIDADVAEGAHLSVLRRRLDAARDERVATTSLASLVGLPPSQPPRVSGSLEPLEPAARVRLAPTSGDAPEVTALLAERRALSARASALRRARVPNPTLSVFLQREGFNEDVAGLGLSLPLPLPEPIGRTFAGPIAESEALAERAGLLAESRRRERRAELSRAIAEYESAAAMVRELDAERVSRAERSSESLAVEVQAGRVAIRDAIVLQQPLLELQLGAIDAKRALCLASLEVLRAAGLALTGETR